MKGNKMSREEFVKEWIAALRSGEYKQAKNTLTRVDSHDGTISHCCLGVACHLAVQHGLVIAKEGIRGTNTISYGDGKETYCEGILPESLQKFLGFSDPEGAYEDAYGVQSLALRNDSGTTFGRIADIIESSPKGLYTVHVKQITLDNTGA